MNEKARAVGENLIVSIGYGDSAGLPAETKKRDAIAAEFGQIRELHAIENPFLGEAPKGSWSDDTQLTLAVADALIQASGFSMDAMAERHILTMDETPKLEWKGRSVPRGWGKSTWESVLQLKEGVHHSNAGNAHGQGNGILMKLAPLALWQTLRSDQNEDEQVEQLTRMTHRNDLSVVTSLIHRDILRGLYGGDMQPGEVIQAATDLARKHEETYRGAGLKTSKLLGQLASRKQPTIDEILEIAPGGGFQSSETLVMAYGAFARVPSYPDNVYEAISYGGDTDSIASIVAGMSVMHTGEVTAPHDVELLHDIDRLRATGRALVSTALRS
jgi:ADP-ribosylglycohydrolase